MPRLRVPGLVFLALLSFAIPGRAGETRVAVAANFTAPAREIAAAFAEETGHRAVLSFGSTGKLYAQIAHGAPYQVYLAADARRPEKAVAEGLAVADSRFTYAIGRLALYSPDPALIDAGGRVLEDPPPGTRLAIANPATAPYGAAAVEAMQRLGVFQANRHRLVRGENIAQTYQFVVTGNARLGFVALSQIIGHDEGSRWRVPTGLHDPIRQDAVLLRTGADQAAAKAFTDFLGGEGARAIIRRYGYDLD